MVDRSLHSISSSKRFKRRSAAPAPPPAEAEQKGSAIPWVVLVGIAIVGFKWWHDKKLLDEAQQKNQRLGTGTAGGWLSWLNVFRRQRNTLRYRGKVGRASADGATEPSTNDQSIASDRASSASAPAPPAVYDKASLHMFAGGSWSVIGRSAAVRLMKGDEGQEGDLHHLHIACGGQNITAPVTTDLSLRGSVSDKTVKFKADGAFWSLEFPGKKNYDAFMADFEASLQHNKAAMASQGTHTAVH